MLLKTLQTTLFQIVCKSIPHFQVKYKSEKSYIQGERGNQLKGNSRFTCILAYMKGSNRKMLKSCASIGCTKRQVSRVSFHIFPGGKVRQKQWRASLKQVYVPWSHGMHPAEDISDIFVLKCIYMRGSKTGLL